MVEFLLEPIEGEYKVGEKNGGLPTYEQVEELRSEDSSPISVDGAWYGVRPVITISKDLVERQ